MNAPLRGQPLARDASFAPLVRTWLGSDGGGSHAAAHCRAFLAAQGAVAPAAAWADAGWREPWLAQLLDDLPDAAARARARQAVAALAAGRADVVVTGQQPGFLGGPLLALWKAAAAVAAAQERSRRGRLTVPLFWFGDDDDDRVEAFAPWLWDPRRAAFLRAPAPAGAADQMVGAARADEWGRAELAWLSERARFSEPADTLARLWTEGMREGLSWGRIQRRALLAVFAPQTLLAVSGRDAGLHGLAAPLYADIWRRREELAAAARRRGRELQAAGGHAQIAPASLERPLHVEQQGRRVTLTVEALSLPHGPPAAVLRPGVMLRAVVQDWLLRPAAVVVGPGEVAYLKQLEGVYELLGVPRSPLLPRLFAVLAPEGEAARVAAGEADAPAGPAGWEDAARSVVAVAGTALAEALRRRLGLSAVAARRAAAPELARWEAGVAQLLARQADRLTREAPAVAPWVRPFGRLQERTLASHWASALWGTEVTRLALAAAAAQLGGMDDLRWQVLTVAAP